MEIITNLKNIHSITKTSFKNWWSKDLFRESLLTVDYPIFSLHGLRILITNLGESFF